MTSIGIVMYRAHARNVRGLVRFETYCQLKKKKKMNLCVPFRTREGKEFNKNFHLDQDRSFRSSQLQNSVYPHRFSTISPLSSIISFKLNSSSNESRARSRSSKSENLRAIEGEGGGGGLIGVLPLNRPPVLAKRYARII